MEFGILFWKDKNTKGIGNKTINMDLGHSFMHTEINIWVNGFKIKDKVKVNYTIKMATSMKVSLKMTI